MLVCGVGGGTLTHFGDETVNGNNILQCNLTAGLRGIFNAKYVSNVGASNSDATNLII